MSGPRYAVTTFHCLFLSVCLTVSLVRAIARLTELAIETSCVKLTVAHTLRSTYAAFCLTISACPFTQSLAPITYSHALPLRTKPPGPAQLKKRKPRLVEDSNMHTTKVSVRDSRE